TSIKTAVKEGVEQGVKNFDTFKGLLKKTKGLGDNIYHSLPTYRKQLARHLQNTVDEGLLNLSKATQEGLERAKQFTLEVPTVVVRETSTGSQIMRFEKMSKSLGDTGLGKSLDNLASKAKHVENTRLDRLRARNASKFKMYNMDDLANLQHTENFTEKSLIHIFEGDVRRRQAGGYHYDMVEGTSGSIIEGTKSPALNDAGVYEAKVEVNGIPKKGNEGYSTFFPDSMSPQEVVDAINEAYETRIFDTDSRNLYEGISKNGMKIKMYLDSEKKIISAYPSSK
ncbi:EndoU domain-containing protein, partial [Streptococcus oralis]